MAYFVVQVSTFMQPLFEDTVLLGCDVDVVSVTSMVDRLLWNVENGLPIDAVSQPRIGASYLGSYPKLQKATISSPVCPPVRMQQLTLPLDGFSWNLTFEDFSKICRENSSVIKIWHEQRVRYMKACAQLRHLAEFFVEWKMFRAKVAEKIITRILC
jgi:hypothetical protein